MEAKHDPPLTTTHGTPNSRIPVTQASSAKLRALILKRHLQTQNYHQTDTPTKSKPAVRLNDDTLASIKRQYDRLALKDPILHSAINEGNLDTIRSRLRECFRENLGIWLDGVQEEALLELNFNTMGTAQTLPVASDDSMSAGQTETENLACDEAAGVSTVYVQFQAPSSGNRETSIASYTALIQEQCASNSAYLRSRSRSRINRPGARGRTRTLTPPQASSGPICTQPVRNARALLPTSGGPPEGGVFVFPDDKYCNGLERLNQLQSLYIQATDGLFNFLNALWPKFLFSTRYDIFHHENLPPIFTIAQPSYDHWGKYTKKKGEDLKYLIRHNDYSGRTLMTDLCLVVECEKFYKSGASLHNATFLLADSGVQLGSCKYYSTLRTAPILFVKSDLTGEAFFVRSRNYTPGFYDSDFFVRQASVTDFEDGEAIIEDREDYGVDRSIVASIARRLPRALTESSELYPLQERLVLSFSGKVHPYTKGTLIAAALVLKHDILK